MMLDITVEKQVKRLIEAKYPFTEAQVEILEKYGNLKQSRFDNGEMYELDNGMMVTEKRYASLDEMAEDTVMMASDYVKRYSMEFNFDWEDDKKGGTW